MTAPYPYILALPKPWNTTNSATIHTLMANLCGHYLSQAQLPFREEAIANYVPRLMPWRSIRVKGMP